jgi:hypothetical protein
MPKAKKKKTRKLSKQSTPDLGTSLFTPAMAIAVAQLEKKIVPVMRNVTSERRVCAFMMRHPNAELERSLPNEMKDACDEIEFCYRYRAGELLHTTNMRAYGITPGRGAREALDDRASKLLPRYDKWCHDTRHSFCEENRIGFSMVNAITLDGLSIRQAATKHRIPKPSTAIHYLLIGLNRYCIIAGWGDVLREHKEYDLGYVYVIGQEDAGPYKIGYSITPGDRLTHLQIGTHNTLHLLFVLKTGWIASQRVEREVHTHFKEKLIRGEWYDASLEDIKDVMRIIHPAGIEINPLDRALYSR